MRNSSNLQLEAYLNEYKGNILEFLIASQISKRNNIESEFLKSIGPSFLAKLGEYESFIQEHRPLLLSRLFELSQKMSDVFLSHCNASVKNVYLIGKVAKAGHDHRFEEADVLVETQDCTHYLSIKMNKYSSLVNTKSAGIKSFLSKYFEAFSSSREDQQSLNRELSIYFNEAMREIHDIYQIEFDSEFKNWNEADLPTLPGELSEEARAALFKLYYRLSLFIFKKLGRYYNENPRLFSQSLLPLLGIGNTKIKQLVCLHRPDKQQLPTIEKIIFEDANKFDFSEMEIVKTDGITSYFDIRFMGSRKLQIRVKPMNKFTAESFKINCAINYN